MHELSVTQSILNIALNEAEKHNAKKISRINIKMGQLSELLPDCIDYYFSIISRDTIAEKAVLNIDKLPLKLECLDCGEMQEADVRSYRCKKCLGQNLKILQGNEFYIDSLEVD
jgi:hydrogenase nickel incorporation protein HypA/HybF